MQVRQAIKSAIETVVMNGGTVTYPHKKAIPDNYGEMKIAYYDHEYLKGFCVFNGWCGSKQFPSFKEAIDYFVEHALGKTNIALAYEGIRKHKLTDLDFEDINEDDMQILVNKYLDEYYEGDYCGD